MIRSIMALATVSAALFGIGVSNVNLVRWSIMERTILHLTPAAEIASDLYSTKSTELFEMAVPQVGDLLVVLGRCSVIFPT